MLFTRLVAQVEVSSSKRALLHLPTPFPPHFSPSPAQDQALLLGEAATSCRRTWVVGRGAEEKTGAGRIVISYQNSRKQH